MVYTLGPDGPDWMILALFVQIILVCFLVWLSLIVPRIMRVCVLFIVIASMTYFPLAAFPSLLVNGYLHMGLISPWHIQNVPQILHFPTLWLFSLCGLHVYHHGLKRHYSNHGQLRIDSNFHVWTCYQVPIEFKVMGHTNDIRHQIFDY